MIEEFRKVEASLIGEYLNDIKLNFAFACASTGKIIEDEKCLTVQEFIEYGLEKKIKFNRNHIDNVIGQETVIREETFVRLLILASCAGERIKLGANNFRLLMEHMAIK